VVEIAGLTPGTQHDVLAVTGQVTLAGSLEIVSSFLAAENDHFVIVANDGADPIIGTFANLAEGAIVAGGARFFAISYHGGDGNDVDLTALAPAVTLSANGHSATFTDADGDLVTIKTTRGTYDGDEFTLMPVGAGGGSVLAQLHLGSGFALADVTITARRGPTGGDGFANVGFIDAAGVNLGLVKITGDLGGIDAGAVKSLTVQSLGALGLSTQAAGGTLTSHFTGPLGKLIVKSDIRDAHLLAGAGAGAVTVVGSVTSAQLSSGADFGAVNVHGHLGGTAAAPTVISAFGKTAAPAAGVDLAIKSLKVGGSVERLRVLAGYDITLAGANADAVVGPITVGGDWRSSTVLAGTSAGPDGFEGTADDAKLTGPSVRDHAKIFSQIAGLTIKGQAIGTTAAGDAFGVVAERIFRAKIGPTALRFDPGERDPADAFPLGFTGPGATRLPSDFFIREAVH
jgi:hypothetical protein